MFRWMIALSLAVASATFTFAQLGFVSVHLPNEGSAYVVVLLQLVALGALLLGTLPAFGLGLVSGTVLYLHARFLPLDHYELSFVTPLTSIVMLGVCGLLLGILFAFALRKDPPRGRRIVYIAVVCITVSWLYSLGFAINVFMSLLISLAERASSTVSDSYVTQRAAAVLTQLGDVSLQAWVAALLMTVLCCIGDYASYKTSIRQDVLGLRTVFGLWLSVVVVLTFMAMGAASFAVTSGDGLRDADEGMKSEVAYLGNQFVLSNERLKTIRKIHKQGALDYEKVDAGLLSSMGDLLEDRLLLEGYTPEDDGIIILTVDDVVYATNDKRFEGAVDLADAFDPTAVEAIKTSEQTGQMQRFVFNDDDVIRSTDESGNAIVDETPRLCIAYVYAQSINDASAVDSSVRADESIIMIRTSDLVFAKRANVMVWTTLSSLVLMLAVLFIVAQLLNRVVARRIDETNGVLARVTDGDLDARVDIKDTREFESLSHGINGTVEALKGWIAEAETRMDAELATAKAIQEAALPRLFPPYPDILRFDIYASMQAAKEVGGDFYDFFLIGDDCGPDAGKLGFVIADVSGKGVPAALFMMKAKTQIRDYMESGMDVGEAVENANRQLCDGNDAGMFVTVFVGVLDYAQNRIEFVNAGHNPPLLWQVDSWRWLKEKSGLPLGLFDGLPYRSFTLDCKIGDQLLLYTDGVTEAMDTGAQLYGEERLEQFAVENFPLHPRQLIEALRRDVAEFTKGAEQSDDITILALEVGVPPEITAMLTVPASVDELPHVNAFIHEELDRRLCPLRAQNQLDIAVEELFVNVARYAYADAPADKPKTVRIGYTYSADPPSITVDIIDSGVAFDPLAKPDAVTPDDIMEVPIGGLGILMAKKSVDEIRYERVDDTNVVSIVKKW